MRKLYEINEDIERCIREGTDPETGEFTAIEELEALKMEADQKIESAGLYAKDCYAEAAMIKTEIDNLTARMNKLIKSADGISDWLTYQLQGVKFQTPRLDIGFRRSVAVECDEDFCAWAYETGNNDLVTHKEVITDAPNKTAIKKFLQSGGELPKARLEIRQNISIK